MSHLLSKCPHCAVAIDEQNRLITEICGHIKCKQCFLLDALQCGQCQYTNNAKSDFNNSAPNAQIKEICKKTTKRILDTPHIHKHVLQNNEVQYECSICCKTFKSRSQIYYHSACGNGGMKKHQCDKCEKSFATKSHLYYHATSHIKQTHNCAQCGKQFNKLVLLIKHQKLHKDFGQCCVECGKLFRSSVSLAIHKTKQHNASAGAMRFKCQLCEKEYFRKSTLRQHMLKHVASRFECDICNKRFQRNSTLQRHLKRHNERTESFLCTVCYHSFSDFASLMRHTKIHEVNLLFKCRLCHITTVRRDNMLRHVRNIHAGLQFQDCIEEIQNKRNNSDSIAKTANDELTAQPSADENSKQSEYIPRMVANSSVIKFVGNVEPVKIPNSTPNIISLPEKSNEAVNKSPTNIAHKNFQKKYDPIEMYRKILISDEDECDINKQNAITTEQIVENKAEQQSVLPQAVSQPAEQRGNSNFSATHWRKNYKYIYEYQE